MSSESGLGPVRAAIDVGSNSTLLTVAAWDGRGWRETGGFSVVTGLGRGTKSTGRLDPEGARQTLAALRRAWKEAAALGAQETVAAATMAARIARDTPEFLAAAEAQATPVVVIPGDTEAELGFRAVVEDPLFANETRVSIVDPGGQSTEIVAAEKVRDDWRVLFRRSFPIGALALREGALKPDVTGYSENLAAVRELDAAIGMEFLPGQSGRTVTLGATGTNLVSIREKLAEWDPERVHGAVLDYEEVSRAVSWLGSLGDAGRRAVVGLEARREHTIHAGALILERCLYALHALECTVSVRGWRHALLSSAEFWKIPVTLG
ncbi:MAG: hypothetical protein KIT11_10610 [Fimbriimonadaceae bacterium]|nr:hypothetical protein [Fimbriimonadaceae bacterium]QYK55771.1 MAG: hypothetical protein KF733_12280 [Fimbriimonadaceae bacterium]